MKHFLKVFVLLTVLAGISSCKKEDPDDSGGGGSSDDPTCTDGVQNGNETGVDCGGDCDPCDTVEWVLIAEDPAGDAEPADGADATALHYQYNLTTDEVKFRITATSVAEFSASPAADFTFGLPNGTDNNDPTGFHWTDMEMETPGHRSAFIYTDPGGSAPDNYSYEEVASGAANRIELTHNQEIICPNICIGISVDEVNNEIIYTFNRTDIITDTEMGGDVAVIALVANLGQLIGWNDNITTSSTFTIDRTSPSVIPTMSTTEATAITTSSAQTGGLIINSGDSQVTERGVCYNTSPEPTTNDSLVVSSSSDNQYSVTIEGLTENTLYYIRSYAINEAGTAYGNELTFTTEANVMESSEISIAELRQMFQDQGDFTLSEDVTIKGIVTTDNSSGNFTEATYMQDETGGLLLDLSNQNAVSIGDSITIDLNGLLIQENDDHEMELFGVNTLSDLEVLSTDNITISNMVSISQLIDEPALQGTLVSIDGVQFTSDESGNTFYVSGNISPQSRFLTDCDGNEIKLSTLMGANFANDLLPGGNGSVTGIVSKINDDVRIRLRSLSEINLQGFRCSGEVLFMKDFEDMDLTSGGWTQESPVGNTMWEVSIFNSNFYAEANNWNGSNNEESVAMFISPMINVEFLENPTLSFTSVTNFIGPELDVFIATDYDPAQGVNAANWNELSVPMLSPGAYEVTASGSIDLSGYASFPSLHIGFVYSGSDNDGAVWQVDNITVFDE